MLRRVAIIAALAGLAAYATITLRGPQGVRALEEKRREIHALEEQNANLRRDIERKKLRLERLRNDPGTLEVEIEKRLGKVRPGVTEFRETGQHLRPEADKAPRAVADQSKPARQ
jgi:predicted nuclease with TOPRIM domain